MSILSTDQLPTISQEDINNYVYSTLPQGTITINSTANNIYSVAQCNPSLGYNYTTNICNTSQQWSSSPYIGSSGSGGLHVSTDAEFEGDIKWKGRSLGKLLEGIEDRLALLAEPDPEKLKKFAALKKAYDHYKLMEKLIGDDVGPDENA